MDFSLLFLPVLQPFAHWCIISASYYLSKYFIESEKSKAITIIGILQATIVISLLASLIFAETWINLKIYLMIMLPAFLAIALTKRPKNIS